MQPLNCGNCLYWQIEDKDKQPTAANRPRGMSAAPFGTCRRHPPKVFMLMVQQAPSVANPQGGGVAQVPAAVSPPTQADHWCGEHRVKAVA